MRHSVRFMVTIGDPPLETVTLSFTYSAEGTPLEIAEKIRTAFGDHAIQRVEHERA